MNQYARLLTNPLQLARRFKAAIYFRSNPTAPWLCPSAVKLLDARLTPKMTALEFGSGKSTAWIGRRVGKLTSIEYNEAWRDKVVVTINNDGLNGVSCRYVPLEHPLSDPEKDEYDPMPAYVQVCDEFSDASLDFVLVDGHYRTHCVRQARRLVKPGGMIMVDDAQRWDGLAVGPRSLLADWELVNDASNGVKRTTTWRRP